MLLAEQRHDARDDNVVCTGQDGEADAVNILLNGCGDDHLRRLAQAGVDDLHARIAQCTRDDFSSTVMAIEPGLGYKNADWSGAWHAPSIPVGGYYCLRRVCHAFAYVQLR